MALQPAVTSGMHRPRSLLLVTAATLVAMAMVLLYRHDGMSMRIMQTVSTHTVRSQSVHRVAVEPSVDRYEASDAVETLDSGALDAPHTVAPSLKGQPTSVTEALHPTDATRDVDVPVARGDESSVDNSVDETPAARNVDATTRVDDTSDHHAEAFHPREGGHTTTPVEPKASRRATKHPDDTAPTEAPVARDDPSSPTVNEARVPVDPMRDEVRPVEGQTVASDTLPMGTSDRSETPEVAGDTAFASPVENGPDTVHHAPVLETDDPHRLDMTHVPLLPWERESLPPTRSCRPPDGMPHYCCVGSTSSAGHIYFAGGECSKNADVYQRAEAYALSYPIAPPHPARSHVACDWCRILDILWDHDWSLTFLGDSVTGQTFFGAECEMRRRGYNVTTLPIDYRQVDPHHWQFYNYGLNQVHEFHVSQPGKRENVAVVRYYLVYRPSRDLVELDEVLQKSNANVLVFDHGLHYRLVPDMLSEFQDTMTRMLTKLTETPSRWKLLAWRETSAQNYDTVDGHYDSDGDMQTCVAMNHNVTRQDETTVDLVRTNIMQNVVQSLSSSVVTTLPFWSYTQSLHELHAGNGDCTHFCTFPSLWRPLWRELRNAMDDAVVRDESLVP